MATQQENVLSSIRDLATCCVCQNKDLSNILKVFPCFHSACPDCLKRKLPSVSNGDMFQCPGCGKEHQMPDEGMEGLEDNFFSVNMKFLTGILSNNPPNCKACEMIGENIQSATYCLLCQGHFCQTDGTKHMATPGHQVIAHSELSSDQIIPKLLSTQRGRCEDFDIHEDPQSYKHFCIQCQTVSCGECLTYKHEGHQKMPLKRAGEKYKNELKEKVEDIRQKRDRKRQHLQALQGKQSRMMQSKEITAQKITAFGDKIKEMVDSMIQNEIQKLEKEADKERQAIENETEQVSFDEKQLDVAIVHIDAFLNYGSHVNVLQKYKVLEKHLEACLDNVGELNPIEDKTFSFFHVNDGAIRRNLQQMILEKEFPTLHIPFVFGKLMSVNHDNYDIITMWRSESQDPYTVFVTGADGKLNYLTEFLDSDEFPGIAAHGHLIYVTVGGEDEVVAFNRDGQVKKIIELTKNGNIDHNQDRKQTCDGHKNKDDHDDESNSDEGSEDIVEDSDESSDESSEDRDDENDLRCLATDPVSGDLYISSSATETIYKCAVNETEAKPLITGGFCGKIHMCVIPNRGLAVLNITLHEIHMYDFEGTLRWKYGSEGSGDGELKEPIGICTDHLGNILVADVGNKILLYISSGGRLIKQMFCRDLFDTRSSLAMVDNKLFFAFDDNVTIIFICNYTDQHILETDMDIILQLEKKEMIRQ